MIKRRNMWTQVGLTIITLGIYAIYLFYITSKEMIEEKRLEGSAVLWTVLSIIPLVNMIAYYKHGSAVEAVTEGAVNKWICFVLWIVFAPAAWFMIQTELNKRATAPA